MSRSRNNFRYWSYEEVCHVLDRVGNLHKVPDDVFRDLGVEVNRTLQAVRTFHYLWLVHSRKEVSMEKYVPHRLRKLFKAYVTNNGEPMFTQHTSVPDMKVSVDGIANDVDAAFEALKVAILHFAEQVVEEKTRAKIKVMQDEIDMLNREKAQSGRSGFVSMLKQRFMPA